MKLFISPHNDDEALFGTFTIFRKKPLVVIVTDAARHAKRGLKNIVEIRREESRRGMSVLGVDVEFLGIPDDALTIDGLVDVLTAISLKQSELGDPIVNVYAPAFYIDGNVDHNVVAQAAAKVFGDRVEYYATYRETDLELKGDIEIEPTPAERRLKELALCQYATQIVMNRPHFDAVEGKSEYFVD